MLRVDTRPVTSDDFELAYRIKCAAMRPYVEATWGWDEETQRRLHATRCRVDESELLLVGEEPVGYLYVVRKPHEIVLVSIHVLPDWQSKGVGTTIIQGLSAEARRAGIPIRLQVLRVNERARALYERHGFRVTETSDTHYQMICDEP